MRCEHYDDGECGLGLYGGTVTVGLCRGQCPVLARDHPDESLMPLAAIGRAVELTVEHKPQQDEARRRVWRRCAEPEPVRWLGITWIGEPWPKRLRLRWPVYVRQLPGCGCIRFAKELVTMKRKHKPKGCGCRTSPST